MGSQLLVRSRRQDGRYLYHLSVYGLVHPMAATFRFLVCFFLPLARLQAVTHVLEGAGLNCAAPSAAGNIFGPTVLSKLRTLRSFGAILW